MKLFVPLAFVGCALAVLATASHAQPPQYTVTPSVIADGAISPSTPQIIKINETAAFTMIPDDHFQFSEVSGTCPPGSSSNNGDGTWNYITGKIKEDCTVIAHFATQQFRLTVTTAGTGGGTVTSSPAGIDCGTDCSEDYDYGTVVTLTATADGNSAFFGWSGDPDCTDGVVTMDAPKSCTAAFMGLYTISTSAAPADGGRVSCSPNPVLYEETSTCTITTNPNYTLVNVSGSCGGTLAGNIYTTNAITANCMVVATFATQQFILNVTLGGNGTGTVTSSPPGIDCGDDCSENFECDTEVTLTATAGDSCTFTGWTGSGCAGTEECVVTLDQAREITATFTRNFPWTMFMPATGPGSRDAIDYVDFLPIAAHRINNATGRKTEVRISAGKSCLDLSHYLFNKADRCW